MVANRSESVELFHSIIAAEMELNRTGFSPEKSQMLKTIWFRGLPIPEEVKEVKSVLVSVQEVTDVKNDLVSRLVLSFMGVFV